MKTTILAMLLALLTLTTLVAFAQPVEEWNKTYGGPGFDLGSSVQETCDGGYIITGWTNSYGAGGLDVLLIKTDSDGNEEWKKTFGGSKDDGACSVQETYDGGYIIIGLTESYGAGDGDVWLIKTDPDGNKVWDKTFGGPNYDQGSSVQETYDGGYIITGLTESYGAGDGDVWLIKTDPDGNKVWDKTFGGSSRDRSESIKVTNDDGYIIVGFTESYGAGNRDIWLIKTDSDGNKVWDKTFGGSNDDIGTSVHQTSDKGYILIGSANSQTDAKSGRLAEDLWLIKTDPNGIEEWNKTFRFGESSVGISVQETNDGGYIIASQGFRTDAIIKTDSLGVKLWDITYGDKRGYPSIRSVQETGNGEYVLTGQFGGYEGDTDVLLIKINET